MTQSVIEGAFGKPSSNLSKFYHATAAGHHNMMGISVQQQQNFELRLQEFESLLRSLIRELQLYLPEEEIQGVYEAGDEYAFYRDLSSLIEAGAREIFIIDNYLDEKLFNLYVEKGAAGAAVRILTNRVSPRVETIARMYASKGRLELRSTTDVHDRVVFLDQRGWVIGQSIKDAAKKKPTYIVEMNEPMLTALRTAHDRLWANATQVI